MGKLLPIFSVLLCLLHFAPLSAFQGYGTLKISPSLGTSFVEGMNRKKYDGTKMKWIMPRPSLQMTTTDTEERAVEEFKMITEDESKIRKIGGIGIGVVTAALFLNQGMEYNSLSAGTFAAISTYRTGAEYQ